MGHYASCENISIHISSNSRSKKISELMEPVTASKVQKSAVALVRQQFNFTKFGSIMRMNNTSAVETIDHNVEREICAA